MKTLVYFNIDDAELKARVDEIDKLLRELEKKTAFIPRPMLSVVPAPDNDCVKIGDIVVYGISALTSEQIQMLVKLIEGFNLINI